MSAFVHLRVHSEYSLIDGLVMIPELIDRLVAQGYPAVALTDHNNLFALIKFYSACTNRGLKPIIGADLGVRDAGGDELYRVLVLAQNLRGYRRLVQLVSRAASEGVGVGAAAHGYVDRAWLEAEPEGLIVLSAGRAGDIGKALLAGQPDLARDRLRRWQACFGDRFFLELQRTGRAGEETVLHGSVALALAEGCGVVATNDVCFLGADDYEAHETRVCIQEGRTLSDTRRVRRYSPEQYLKSGVQMAALFADIPEALANAVAIARRCNVELDLGRYSLPEYPVPAGHTLETFFAKVCHEGLEARLAVLLDPAAGDGGERRAKYEARLLHEMQTIQGMGFAGYFLIVMEFINWAKQNDIPVGPGRGSGAASLVAYSLGITDLDPLAYDLLFERLLNPERVSMPDFDIDFCMFGRDRVIAHVADTYGHEAVAQIVTFGTMAAKAVVRDVARVLGKPYGLADRLAKLIPFEVGMTLAKARLQEPQLAALLGSDEEVAEIWEMATKLEGVVRNCGRHAAGVVIAPTRLTDYVPLMRDEAGGALISQFDKDDVELVGLVKFDFLGLKTLTIIDWAVRGANAERDLRGEPPIDIARIPLDDPAVFALLKRADTAAVFQLESRGMRDLIRRLAPDSFDDIIALVALYRPGPMELIPDFIERKHGRMLVAYPDPRMEPILRATYGVMVYQEQVLQIARAIGGYTLGGADLLRKAMGKKLPEEMARHRDRFVAGAGELNVEPRTASQIFDLMEKFAGYGFNKAHSACYALVAYQTAWLKAHYPQHFMAATLSADMQTTDKIVPLIDECRRAGITVLPPDVNEGLFRFTVHEQSIRYGLGAIKGVGEATIAAVVEARQQSGAFADLDAFCGRVDSGRLNKRAIEAFIRAGALDRLLRATPEVAAAAGAPGEGVNARRNLARAQLLQDLPDSMRSALQASRDVNLGMTDMFGGVAAGPAAQAPRRCVVTPMTNRERINAEKEALGLYLTGHPIEEYEAELRVFAGAPIAARTAGEAKQVVAGLLVGVRMARSKRGDPLAILSLDDRSGRLDVTLYGEALARCRDKLVKDQVLVAEGVLLADEFAAGVRMRAEQVLSITEARIRHAEEVRVRWRADLGVSVTTRLETLLRPYRRQGTPLTIEMRGAGACGVLRLGREWQVEPCDELLAKLRQCFGPDAVRVLYASGVAADQ